MNTFHAVLGVRILKQQPFSSLQPNHNYTRKTLFQKIHQISENISEQSDSTITKIPLFGDSKLDFETSNTRLI